MTFRRALYTGVVDYNHLELAFLTAAVLTLMLGMVFSSHGFAPASVGYATLTAVTTIIIVGSSIVFACLLAFEVYRSVKLEALDAFARSLEVDKLERAAVQAMVTSSSRSAARRSSVAAMRARVGNMLRRRTRTSQLEGSTSITLTWALPDALAHRRSSGGGRGRASGQPGAE